MRIAGSLWEMQPLVPPQTPWIRACVLLRSQVTCARESVSCSVVSNYSSPFYSGEKWGFESFKEFRCPFSHGSQIRPPACKVSNITTGCFPYTRLSLHACHTGRMVPEGFGGIAWNERYWCKAAGSAPRPQLKNSSVVSCDLVLMSTRQQLQPLPHALGGLAGVHKCWFHCMCIMMKTRWRLDSEWDFRYKFPGKVWFLIVLEEQRPFLWQNTPASPAPPHSLCKKPDSEISRNRNVYLPRGLGLLQKLFA